VVKNPPANAGDIRDVGSIPGSENMMIKEIPPMERYAVMFYALYIMEKERWTEVQRCPDSCHQDGW